MILVTEAVVLSRKSFREYDRTACLYTRTLGRLTARFVGVDRPKAKLRALAEPMVHGEYRLYVRVDGRMATVTGGRLVDSHPGLREDFSKALAGLEMCELLQRLTPESAPSLQKFALITEHLRALEAAASPWLPVSFGLRLLRLAGFAHPSWKPLARDRATWELLLDAEPSEIGALPADADSLARIRHMMEETVEHELGVMLNARAFRESLGRAAGQGARGAMASISHGAVGHGTRGAAAEMVPA